MRTDAVPELVEAARADLAAANRELEALRRDHRRLETVLESLLEHVPAAVVVVDACLCVRAQSAAADDRWGDRVGRPLDGPLVDACRGLLSQAPPARTSVDGVQLVLVVEPATADRYILWWVEDGPD